MMSRITLFVVLIVSVVATSARPAYASGYYNMPTSLSQCFGLGYGPGYHAPLMLSRTYKAKIATQRVRRMPAPLSPQPSSYGAYGVSTSEAWATPCEGGSRGASYDSGASTGVYGTMSEGNQPAFAPPELVVPHQVVVPQYSQPIYQGPAYQGPNYQGPSTGPHFPSAAQFPSARVQKPMLLW